MKPLFTKSILLAGLLLLALPSLVLAVWPEDPATDLFIGDGPGEQTVPHMVMLADGSCYSGWYDNSTGNYNVAVQYLDADGNEVWAHNGLLASDQPQDSWVMDWDLDTADGDAITAVRDIRTGNPTVAVNRITPAGDFPWGADGIVVASNSSFIGPPNLAVTGNGDVVVTWEEHPDSGDHTIRIQRIAPDGTLRYADGGLVVHGTSTEMPGRPQVIAAGEGDVIVTWVPNDGFMANRQVALQKFDADGVAVWLVPITVFDGGSLPMGHDYALIGDGAEGVVVSWESGVGTMIYSYVQHLDAFGDWMLPYGGVRLSTDADFSQVYPTVCYDQADQTILAFWRKTNGNQTQFGLQGQKLSATGEALWGDMGRMFVPVGDSLLDFLTSAQSPAGITLAWISNPSTAWGQDMVTAMMVDYDGNVMWDPSPVDAASTLSNKSSLLAGSDDNSSTRLIWKDERSGTPDILAKSINIDGTLGGGSVPVMATSMTLVNGQDELTLTWTYLPQMLDGFNVYRRVADGPRERLNDQLISSSDGRVIFRDAAADVAPGTALHYSYSMIQDGEEIGLSIELSATRPGVPSVVGLTGNHPNPFNPSTTITFSLVRSAEVNLVVLDAAGRRVRTLVNEVRGVADHAVIWNGNDDAGRRVASGVYHARLVVNGEVSIHKMSLIK